MARAVCILCEKSWCISNRTNREGYICPYCVRVERRREWLDVKKRKRRGKRG